ncbi:hypothetical protein BDV30DRAFT_232998 [Aspergillus minisclerotigenes]|uniref:Uncharacterized protein n=1 Tax=Aspergillus minisclerotigenes TaxID=656917 RepID=A0A5N6JJN6_9EURO|nr:hypothetical protein BDV30DRAFT_232998 [Aspergillus minisclerotigenes]
MRYSNLRSMLPLVLAAVVHCESLSDETFAACPRLISASLLILRIPLLVPAALGDLEAAPVPGKRDESNLDILQGKYADLEVLNSTRLFVNVLKWKVNPQLAIPVPTVPTELDAAFAHELPPTMNEEEWTRVPAIHALTVSSGASRRESSAGVSCAMTTAGGRLGRGLPQRHLYHRYLHSAGALRAQEDRLLAPSVFMEDLVAAPGALSASCCPISRRPARPVYISGTERTPARGDSRSQTSSR